MVAVDATGEKVLAEVCAVAGCCAWGWWCPADEGFVFDAAVEGIPLVWAHGEALGPERAQLSLNHTSSDLGPSGNTYKANCRLRSDENRPTLRGVGGALSQFGVK